MSFPKFPKFRKFSVNDRDEYLRYYAQLDAPYSDLSINDVCIWLDYHNDLEVSELHGNVIFRYTNILTRGNRSYTIVGISNLERCIQDLRGVTSILSYTPQHTTHLIAQIQDPDIRISEDIDNSDYVYNVTDFLALKGKHHKNLRKRLNLFKRTYPNTHIRKLDLTSLSDITLIVSHVKKWSQQESSYYNDPESREVDAITTHLKLADHLDIEAYGIFIDNTVIGVNIFHLPPHKDWLIFNHTKYDHSYRDISRFAFYSLFHIAKSQGIKWVNSEQDLGIEGLRNLKKYFRPDHHLRRYTIFLD